tara:strand:+ start:1141 stop:1593 length:453 start_codon:yes stop_codon:yes gene_type:complete
MDKIVVQTDDFDLTTEVRLAKANNSSVGAIVSFVGTVRDLQPKSLSSMTLEHYPGMTEKSLESIVIKARDKWEMGNVTIIHRIGTLDVNDQIVLVITTSKHRQEAFDSCNFIMDYLKTDAPFWKKEVTENNEEWVEANSKDEKQKNRWKP